MDGEEEAHPGEASHVVVEEADKGSLMLGKLSVSCKSCRHDVRTSSHDFMV